MTAQVEEELKNLSQIVTSADLPQGLSSIVLARLNQLSSLMSSPTFLPEFDRMVRYVDWITNLPWMKETKDILDIDHATQVLEEHHFGLGELKDRVLEYISVLKLNEADKTKATRAPILCFVGLVGTGKTTFAYSIADALGRKIARIPFGGMGDPLDLRGQSKLHAEAEPGKIIKALRTTGVKNPVILLDEIDRVTDEGRASIMGVLVELLDPAQNNAFVDHYIDYPFDLSNALFIATANNTLNVSTAVMDRLEPIMMPSYSDMEKVTIAREYVLPRILKDAGLPENAITIDDAIWPTLVRPLGFDAGIRTLERTIQGLVRKIARMVVQGKGDHYTINAENVKEFIPK